MAATVKTRELIGSDVKESELKARIKLMLKAGCIRSTVEMDPDGKRWLVTEWNVIGEND